MSEPWRRKRPSAGKAASPPQPAKTAPAGAPATREKPPPGGSVPNVLGALRVPPTVPVGSSVHACLPERLTTRPTPPTATARGVVPGELAPTSRPPSRDSFGDRDRVLRTRHRPQQPPHRRAAPYPVPLPTYRATRRIPVRTTPVLQSGGPHPAPRSSPRDLREPSALARSTRDAQARPRPDRRRPSAFPPVFLRGAHREPTVLTRRIRTAPRADLWVSAFGSDPGFTHSIDTRPHASEPDVVFGVRPYVSRLVPS